MTGSVQFEAIDVEATLVQLVHPDWVAEFEITLKPGAAVKITELMAWGEEAEMKIKPVVVTATQLTARLLACGRTDLADRMMSAAEPEGMAEAATRAIYMNEIPAQYRQYPLLGRGNTAIILAKDNATALVFTRDQMKVEWLCRQWGLGLGQHVDRFAGHRHPIPAARELDIQVVEMPRMERLSKQNAQLVRKSVAEFERRFHELAAIGTDYDPTRKGGGPATEARRNLLARLLTVYEADGDERDPIYRYLQFLSAGYDSDDLNFDIALRNFMQTHSGEIVLLDPAVAKNIRDILFPGQNVA